MRKGPVLPLFPYLVVLSGFLFVALASESRAQVDVPINGELVEKGSPSTQYDVELYTAPSGRRFIATALGKVRSFELLEVEEDGQVVKLGEALVTPGRICRDVKFFTTNGKVFVIAAEESITHTGPFVTGPGAHIYEVLGDPKVKYVSSIPRSLLRGSHNQEILEIGGSVYYFTPNGEAHGGPTMQVFKLDDPTQPALVGSFSSVIPVVSCPGRPFGFQHVHSCTARYNQTDGRPYLYLFIQPEAGSPCPLGYFSIYDVSDPSRPLFKGARVTNITGTWVPHSGFPSDDGTRLYVTSELWGRALRIYDISQPNPQDPFTSVPLVRTIQTKTPTSMYHDPEVLDGEFLVVSGYENGTTVFDLADQDNPLFLAQLDTSDRNISWNFGIVGNWGTASEVRRDRLGRPTEISVYVGDLQDGLSVFRLTPIDIELSLSSDLLLPGSNIVVAANLRNKAVNLSTFGLFGIRFEIDDALEIPLVATAFPVHGTGPLFTWEWAFTVPDYIDPSLLGKKIDIDLVAHFLEPGGDLCLERRLRFQIVSQER